MPPPDWNWLPTPRSEILPVIASALDQRFVYAGEIADLISAAFYEPCNLLLWGPGGHGKSEMVLSALHALGLTSDEIYIQSFGEGMSEDRLWGGPDMASLDTCLRYDTSHSFLAPQYKAVIFEEIFDAPAQSLLPLKDVLTRRVFVNGGERVALNAKVVIACTNKDPREFSDGNDAVLALLERFLLQKEVRWPAYEAKNYAELFAKTRPSATEGGRELHQRLAAVIAGLNETKTFIMSPRMALQSLEVVASSARARGDDRVTSPAFHNIRFVQGMQSYTADLDRKIDRHLPSEPDFRIQLGDGDFANTGDGPLRQPRHLIPKLVASTLQPKFIHCDEIVRVLTLAFIQPCNVLLWGPGGHGKSDMVMTALKAMGYAEEEIFLQSFGEGMSEDRLWGGPNIAKLDVCLEYDTDRSFLPYEVVILEEILDASSQALLPLKDVLTRKTFMNGSNPVAMKSKVIIACTNKDPRQFAKDSDAVKALLERFPLQLEVRWPSYEQADYEALFGKANPGASSDKRKLHRIYAHVIANLNEDRENGFHVSPRIALGGLRLAGNSVGRHGRKKMIVEDILTIRNVQGMESYKRDIEGLIRSALLEGGIEVLLSDIDQRAERLRGKMEDINEMFAAGRQVEANRRGEVNDVAIDAMLELMSSMDRLKHELNMLEIADPKLQAWQRATTARVREIAAEIEAGT
ncbi:AAA domain (dynein-related subfamily) [Rubripirellula lacrimiformis]|uniref:AAA domain (Dynein-related subfamily) n=1 Tax=Rubripirellula lacrimiformis TaxID=1930273 RepID=A0A517N8V3_9BACT|nr:AAA family ATPase [Rubripirellula lacrimiformis]QDT03573.1 AAA domain (dynein-related subfamily) [Rubripirellula lacrimiformis]